MLGVVSINSEMQKKWQMPPAPSPSPPLFFFWTHVRSINIDLLRFFFAFNRSFFFRTPTGLFGDQIVLFCPHIEALPLHSVGVALELG